MTLDKLAELIVIGWAIAGFALFFYVWLSSGVLIHFLISRIIQIRDRAFDLRPNIPTHAALFFFCAIVHGLVLPSFYFLTVRTRHALGPWHLGSGANSGWTILLGVVCMAWLVAHLVEAVSRLDRVRFSPHWINRLVAATGFLLCLWFHLKTTQAGLQQPTSEFGSQPFISLVLMSVIYPQVGFLGTTLVFGFALLESLRGAGAGVPSPAPRRWRLAAVLAAVPILIVFAPFWLSIPRVTDRQALALLEENRDLITDTAQWADLDPRLLAGIVFVAQTRDHPRWIGDVIEDFGLRLWQEDIASGPFTEFGAPLINASTGLCQIRPTTAAQTLLLIDSVIVPAAADLGLEGAAIVSIQGTWRWNSVLRNFTNANVNRFSGMGRLVPTFKFLLARVGPAASDADMHALLSQPDSNIAMAAIMLHLLREQWSNSGFPIDDRPDILATLYNLGYERSNPHGEPRANDFGRRVAEFMQTDECRSLFPDREDSAR